MSEISEYINNDYRPIDSRETVASIKDFFAEEHFTHFPIVEESVYIGSIGADDVDTFEDAKDISHYRYALEGFFARTTMLWLDVLELFARYETNVVPVLDESNNYVGYYESADIIKLFNDTPFLKEQGGIIIVEKGIADYSIGQITQIVESNNGKILGMFISEARVDTVQVTIKITIGGMNEILQTFRRYNYEIISEHQEDNYLNSLRDRSDYLDKYLNI
ncbi:CBS domain-containing protein [Flavobacterium selenitireducens]|uniref:CBS domain-containing protein n=1 Tax=Flavobacterium selenitireducens TaxID=2722704 RepID=UPI00168AF933|nr:CBS domain-containing protein [Flavobacterium selenitireducens]MBD3583869.1 CBS domain-containing protein [Flavobacterium selenitireducens]